MTFEETVKEYTISILAGKVLLKDISETAANLTALLKKGKADSYKDLIKKLMQEFPASEFSPIPREIAEEVFNKAYDLCDASFLKDIEEITLETFKKLASFMSLSKKEFYETFEEFTSMEVEVVKSKFQLANSLEETLSFCFEYEKANALLEYVKEKHKTA